MSHLATIHTARGIAAYLRTIDPVLVPPLQIVSGISRGYQVSPSSEEQDTSVPLPRIVVHSATAPQLAHLTGSWRPSVTVELQESADDTSEADHLAKADLMLDALMQVDLAELITVASTTAVIPLTVQLAVVESVASEVRERRFIFTVNLTLDVVCRTLA